MSNLSRKEKKTFIDLAAKKTQTEMHEEVLIIHIKFDYSKTAKFRAKMKSMSVLKPMYLGQFLLDLSKLGLKI